MFFFFFLIFRYSVKVLMILIKLLKANHVIIRNDSNVTPNNFVLIANLVLKISAWLFI